MRGIDVHQDKGNPDWQRVFAAGIRFAWLKVSEGAGGSPNPAILTWFRHNVPAAKAAGIRVGGYHFLTTAIPSSTPVEEADFFLSRLSLHQGDLLPVVEGLPPRLRVGHWGALTMTPGRRAPRARTRRGIALPASRGPPPWARPPPLRPTS